MWNWYKRSPQSSALPDSQRKREDIIIGRLEDQISWYDRKSMVCQSWFKWLKVISISAAATVPALAAGGFDVKIIATLGVVITICEGLQQLNQYQQNWTSYRSTCEALKHEKFAFYARTGPYQFAEDPYGALAERIESLVSTEHSKWIANQPPEGNQRAGEKPSKTGTDEAAERVSSVRDFSRSTE